MSQSRMVLFLQLAHAKSRGEKLEKSCCPNRTLKRVKMRHLLFSISATINTSVKLNSWS